MSREFASRLAGARFDARCLGDLVVSISSLSPDHPPRPADDPTRFGETVVDTNVESLPEERPIEAVMITLSGFRCVQTTSGPGDDEVVFALTVRPDLGGAVSVERSESDDVAPSRMALGEAIASLRSIKGAISAVKGMDVPMQPRGRVSGG